MHARKSRFAHQMELGEAMWARRKEEKAGAVTVWKHMNKRSKDFLEMSKVIYALIVNHVLKKSESEKKTKKSGGQEQNILSTRSSVKAVLIW